MVITLSYPVLNLYPCFSTSSVMTTGTKCQSFIVILIESLIGIGKVWPASQPSDNRFGVLLKQGQVSAYIELTISILDVIIQTIKSMMT